MPAKGAFEGAALAVAPSALGDREFAAVSDPAALPPVLLTNANYNGTVAAVRSLGQAGIRVTTADPSRFAVGAWSKYTASRVVCPSVRDTQTFVDWLVAFGRAHGKHVLLPTSDDTAWVYSLHRDELSQYFHLSSPPVDVMYRLLNKKDLYHEAVHAGLHVPRTWFPETVNDLGDCVREARFPVVVKPRTQVMFRTQSKGAYVQTANELSTFYNVMSRQPYEANLLALDPSASRPMVQEFYAEAATGIYNISAYIRDGVLCGVRASRKLLQQPRRLGTGVCFEAVAVTPALAAGLERLAQRIGFSGVFEAEFIQHGDHAVLIDFNPRFYSQMAFDIARGLQLPLLAYFDALGSVSAFNELCEMQAFPAQVNGQVYVDLISLRILLGAQRLSGALSPADVKKWNDWYRSHRDQCTYAVRDDSDKLPFWLAAAQLLLRYGRHPRNFLRSIVLNRYCFLGVSGVLGMS
jgi:predicted ATP-grasp superfamily ATP-dependent carboligase